MTVVLHSMTVALPLKVAVDPSKAAVDPLRAAVVRTILKSSPPFPFESHSTYVIFPITACARNRAKYSFLECNRSLLLRNFIASFLGMKQIQKHHKAAEKGAFEEKCGACSVL